jgi:hypothetical protein
LTFLDFNIKSLGCHVKRFFHESGKNFFSLEGLPIDTPDPQLCGTGQMEYKPASLIHEHARFGFGRKNLTYPERKLTLWSLN